MKHTQWNGDSCSNNFLQLHCNQKLCKFFFVQNRKFIVSDVLVMQLYKIKQEFANTFLGYSIDSPVHIYTVLQFPIIIIRSIKNYGVYLSADQFYTY